MKRGKILRIGPAALLNRPHPVRSAAGFSQVDTTINSRRNGYSVRPSALTGYAACNRFAYSVRKSFRSGSARPFRMGRSPVPLTH